MTRPTNAPRWRSDVVFAKTPEGILLRHGHEETLRLEGVGDSSDEHAELSRRGLLINSPPEQDWQVALCGSVIRKKIHIERAPVDFADALLRHGILGNAAETAAALFVEVGVDLPSRWAVHDKLWAHHTPLLWMQIPSPLEIRWTTFVPGETACAHCLETRLLAGRNNPDAYRAVVAEHDGVLPACPPPAAVRMAAEVAAIEASRLLTNSPLESLGRLRVLDLSTFRGHAERLLPVPRCETCGADPEP